MPTTLNPYLGFRDEARSAMDLYQSVFGGDVTRSTFGEMNLSDDPAEADKVMHSQLVTPGGMVLMAADTPNSMEHTAGGSISVSLSGEDEDELRGYFEKLSDGGTVVLRLTSALESGLLPVQLALTASSAGSRAWSGHGDGASASSKGSVECGGSPLGYPCS